MARSVQSRIFKKNIKRREKQKGAGIHFYENPASRIKKEDLELKNTSLARTSVVKEVSLRRSKTKVQLHEGRAWRYDDLWWLKNLFIKNRYQLFVPLAWALGDLHP